MLRLLTRGENEACIGRGGEERRGEEEDSIAGLDGRVN
jgi:hypothetical protein